jgi:hypothetical protein
MRKRIRKQEMKHVNGIDDVETDGNFKAQKMGASRHGVSPHGLGGIGGYYMRNGVLTRRVDELWPKQVTYSAQTST